MLRATIRFRARLLSVTLLLLAVFGVEGNAQVRFAQITDPHLFDEESQALNNRKALAACVKKINERADSGISYEFVLVTGDIGVEKIIEKLHNQKERANTQSRANLDIEITKELNKGVRVLSESLATSKVRL